MQLEHTYIQPLSFPAGFFRELWYLARAIILAFFIAVLISSVFSAQVRGGSECSQAECRSFEQKTPPYCVCVCVCVALAVVFVVSVATGAVQYVGSPKRGLMENGYIEVS